MNFQLKKRPGRLDWALVAERSSGGSVGYKALLLRFKAPNSAKLRRNGVKSAHFTARPPDHDGTGAAIGRYCVMKKIALISASVLALGAAAIAADADGLTYLQLQDRPSLNPAGMIGSVMAEASPLRGNRIARQENARKIRLIASNVATPTSCEAANWPYYPQDCLAPAEPPAVETAGL